MAVDGWVEVDAMTAMRDLGHGEVAQQTAQEIVDMLLSLDDEQTLLRVEFELPSDLEPGQLGMMVPRTRLFIHRERARDIRGDVLTAAAVYAFTHSVSVSTATALFRRLASTIRLLDETELDLIAIITGTAATLESADTPVSLKQIERAFDGNRPAALPDRLDRLVKRGVLTKVSGGYVLTP